MGDDTEWQENPLYQAPEWQENPLYDDPGGPIQHVDPDALDAFKQGLAGRANQETTPINEVNPMEDPDTMKQYVAESLGVRRNWDTMSPKQRMDAMTGAAGDAGDTAYGDDLGAQYVSGALPPGTAGSTDPATGIVTVSPNEFSATTPALDAETVNTLYHETTHVEQRQVADDTVGFVGPLDERTSGLRGEMIDDFAGTMQVENTAGAVAQRLSTGGAVQPGDAGAIQAYHDLQIETEAHAAGDAAGRMYERVGAVHDELEARTAGTRAQLDQEAQERSDALENLQNFQELPQDV